MKNIIANIVLHVLFAVVVAIAVSSIMVAAFAIVNGLFFFAVLAAIPALMGISGMFEMRPSNEPV